MTWNNLNPLANPFNSRTCKCSFNKNCKTLPQSSISYDQIMQQQDQLHVPFSNFDMRLADFQNIIDDYARDKTWDNTQTINDIVSGSLENTPQLSKRDQEYWNKANIESARLSSSLSKEWQNVIEQFEAQHPSKFEDDIEDMYNMHMKGNI